jgi:hypothetical protein
MATQTDAVEASRLPALLETFFATKTAGDVDGTMAYFAPDMAACIDATLGWDLDSYAALKAVFEQYMPTWAPPARSYASKILAGEQSDTPTYARNPRDISNMNTIAPTIRAGLKAQGVSVGEART